MGYAFSDIVKSFFQITQQNSRFLMALTETTRVRGAPTGGLAPPGDELDRANPPSRGEGDFFSAEGWAMAVNSEH